MIDDVQKALQIFVANRDERIRAEKVLKALQRKEDEAARVLSNLVKGS